MNDSYLMINGKRVELTPEQLAALGVENPKEPKRSPFERVDYGEEYYFIDAYGEVKCEVDLLSDYDDSIYAATNYCTDESLMKQRALHEILNRRLWRYSMEHGGDKVSLNEKDFKWAVQYNCESKGFGVHSASTLHELGSIYFAERVVAFDAINEIVKPFMEEHPEFVW